MVSLPIEERLAFQGSMLRLLAERSTEADVRRVMETDAGYDPDVWKALAEIGAVGLLVDPEYGGAGAGPLELELVMEAVGAALLCSPLLTSGVLAAGLLQALGDAEANARLLPGIADGSRIATAALTGSGRRRCAGARRRRGLGSGGSSELRHPRPNRRRAAGRRSGG